MKFQQTIFNQARNNSKISSIQQASNQNHETINDINSAKKNRNEILMKTTEIFKLQSISDSQQRKINQIEQENSQLKDEIIKLKAKVEELSQQEKKEFSQQINDFQIFDSSMIKELEMIDEIGNNNYGKIYKVSQKVTCALKVINNKNITHEQFQQFIEMQKTISALNHPNLLKSYGIFLSNDEIPTSILAEYCPMNLNDAIKNKTFSKVQRVCSIYEIASGMKLLHFNRIIHRNIKPSNILISNNGQIKISDFGIFKLVSSDDDLQSSGIGTQKFMAPEMINEQSYNEKVDVYSFGVIVYFILTNGEMPKITLTQIGTGKKAEIPSDFTEFTGQLVNYCWNFNPEERPSFEDILSQLDDNAHYLLDLTQSEINEVKEFIEKHQHTIPLY